MIKGVGIDIVENKRLLNLINKNEQRFIQKMLHKDEQIEFSLLENESMKAKYLASRWALKEALVKATNNKYIAFHLVKLNKSIDESYNLYVEHHPTEKDNTETKEYEKINRIINEQKFLCSISHEENYSVGVVIASLNKMI